MLFREPFRAETTLLVLPESVSLYLGGSNSYLGNAEMRTDLVPRCLGWVETSLRGQPQVEFAGQQVDDGLEIAG
jgi:hypothetical protein